MEQDIQLTAAELEMIKLKREQEQLKLQEEKLKKQVAHENQVASKVLEIQRHQERAAELLAQYRTVFKELHGLNKAFELRVETRQHTATIRDLVDGAWVTTWSRDYTTEQAEILFSTQIGQEIYRYRVDIERHKAKWVMSTWGPDLHTNRKYTRTGSVYNAIQEKIQSFTRIYEQKLRSQDSCEQVAQKMKQAYPDAQVEIGEDYEKRNNGRHQIYDKIKVIRIEFQNGVKAAYRVYNDGTITRRSLEFPKQDPWILMDKLNKL